MALVMMSPKSLDWMENITKQNFSAIIDRKIKRVRYPQQYLATAETFRYIEVKPIKDLRELRLHFPLPALDPHVLSQPGGLLGYIIGHEGEGSLLSALKKENLATGLSAGAYASTPDYGSFNISISLTPEGRKNTFRITELCFAALKTIQTEGLPQHIFDEVKTKQQLEKVFSHRGEGTGRASELATNLNRYPVELAETLRFCLSEKDDDLFIAFAKKLTPNNCLIMLSAKDADTDSTEPIYGTAFSYREDDLWYQKLKKVTSDANIHLPKPNPFFPASAEVLPEQPALVIDEPGLQLYYLQDRDFLRPKANLLFRLKPNDFSTSLKTSVSIDIAIACIQEQLNEMLYPASLAGADLNLSRDDKGILIQLSGYDQSLPQLLSASLKKMSSLSLGQEKFSAVLDRMTRNWKNFSKESAYQQARIITRSLRRQVAHTPQAKAMIAKELKRDDIVSTIERMWSKLHIEALAYGNIELGKVIQLTKDLRRSLKIESIKNEKTFKISTLTWPEAEQLTLRDELDTNNACFRLDVWLGEDSPELRAASKVLNNVISQPFYVEMRTRQQLGYIVASATYRDGHDHYLVFIIQSGTHNAKQLGERCRKYIPELSDVLEQLTQSEFLALKEAVREKLEEKPKSISTKASLLFQLAYEENGNFGLRDHITTALEELTKQDLLSLLKRALDSKTEKSLTLELFAKDPAPALLEGGIKNIEAFKQSRIYRTAP